MRLRIFRPGRENMLVASPKNRSVVTYIAAAVILCVNALLLGCPANSLLTEIQDKVNAGKSIVPTISSAVGGIHQVTVSWAPVSGATSYNLYWASGSTVTAGKGTKVANAVSPQIVSGLVDGTQYAFILTAMESSGESAASSVATVITSCTVTYNANGAPSGSPPTDSNGYQKGQTETVLANTGNLAEAGEKFIGWNTQANGNGTEYTPGQLLTMGSADLTLYAQWTALPTYTLTYNANGPNGQTPSGTVPIDTTNYLQGAVVNVQVNNPGNLKVSGYTFSGWNTQQNGLGTTYSGTNSTFTMGTANVTLYALWVQTYTVTYYANGASSGAVPVDPNNYAQGAVVTVLGNTGSLTKQGYNFSGWNTQANGQGTTYSSTFTMGNANVSLYALWTIQLFTLTVVAAGPGSNPGGTVTPPQAVKVQYGVATVITATISGWPSSPGYYNFSGWNVSSGSATIANASSYSTTVTLTSGDATIQGNFGSNWVLKIDTTDSSGNAHSTTALWASWTTGISISTATGYGTRPYVFFQWLCYDGVVTWANDLSPNTTAIVTGVDQGGYAETYADYTPF